MPGTENRVKLLVVHRKEILKLASSHPRSSISNCMVSHGGLSKQSKNFTLPRYRQNQESPFEPESLNTEGCRSLLGKAQIVKVMRVASDEVDVHLYRASANNCARKNIMLSSRETFYASVNNSVLTLESVLALKFTSSMNIVNNRAAIICSFRNMRMSTTVSNPGSTK